MASSSSSSSATSSSKPPTSRRPYEDPDLDEDEDEEEDDDLSSDGGADTADDAGLEAILQATLDDFEHPAVPSPASVRKRLRQEKEADHQHDRVAAMADALLRTATPPPAAASQPSSSAVPAAATSSSSSSSSSSQPLPSNLGDLEKMAKDLMDQITPGLKAMMEELAQESQPGGGSSSSPSAPAAGAAASSPASARGDASSLDASMADMSRTLEALISNASKLQEDGGIEGLAGLEGLDGSEEMLRQMMAGLMSAGDGGSGGEASGGSDPMGMIEGMMGSLLSKEVLYPSLQEVAQKYKPYLDANKEKLPAKQFENYERQYAYIRDICSVYEDDSIGGDTQRQRVMLIMERMQECGPPPQELVSSLDGAGMPMSPSNCTIS